jgi:drug/metabolite transporter (DMT)-like permease
MSAIVLALISGLGFGSSAIFARVGMQGVSPLASTFISVSVSFLPAIILALVFAISDIKDLPPVAIALFLALGAINFLGGRNLSYQAIGRIGAARATAILGTAAVFASIFAITLTGERPHVVVLLGTLVVVGGLAAALGKTVFEVGNTGKAALVGYLMALGAAACYGGTNVFAKELTEEYGSPLMISAFSLFFGIVLLWPIAGKEAIRTVRQSRHDPKFVFFAGLSGLAAATGVICLYYALQRSDVAVISPIVSANPLVTLLLAQLFISRLEELTRSLFIGTGVVVVGVMLVVLGSTL